MDCGREVYHFEETSDMYKHWVDNYSPIEETRDNYATDQVINI